MKLDLTGAQVVIGWRRNSAHHGRLFNINVSDTINTGETLALSITTPATNHTRLFFHVDSNASGNFIFAEGDVISGGTPVTPVNFNRPCCNTYGGTVVKDATRDTPGTTLDTIIVGSAGKYGSGENEGNDVPWILKASTTYTILFTADGDDTTLDIGMQVEEF